MKVLSAAIVVCLAIGASSLHVKNIACSNDVVESGTVDFLDVSPCTSDPCALSRGSTYTFQVSFATGAQPESITAMETHLYGIIGGVKLPFPGFNHTETCKDSGLICPLGPNKPYDYKIPIFIDPKVTIDIECIVEVRIEDTTTGKDLLCNKFQVKVVN